MGVLGVGARAHVFDFLRKKFNLDQKDLAFKKKMSNSHLFTKICILSTIIVNHLKFISQGQGQKILNAKR